jgi:hypothetical protein
MAKYVKKGNATVPIIRNMPHFLFIRGRVEQVAERHFYQLSHFYGVWLKFRPGRAKSYKRIDAKITGRGVKGR